MSVSFRNKTASALAVIGGLLIFISGSTGMVGFLTELKSIVTNLVGSAEPTIETVFWILIFIATLGGIAVMLAGYLIYKNYVIPAKILITLGTSMGFFGLILGIITATYHGTINEFFAWITTSFSGLGIVFSIIAQFVAKSAKPAKRSSKARSKNRKEKKRR